MGGGGTFPTCTIIFSDFLLVSIIFFKSSPARIFFFQKSVGERGGEVNIFSGH